MLNLVLKQQTVVLNRLRVPLGYNLIILHNVPYQLEGKLDYTSQCTVPTRR